MSQLALPVSVSVGEIARKRSLGASIELCAEVAGYTLDKQLACDLGVDASQFSRWLSETEGVKWSKLRRLMDRCGNVAPVLWMLHDLGFDPASVRRRETETERELRTTREALDAERMKVRVLTDALRGQQP